MHILSSEQLFAECVAVGMKDKRASVVAEMKRLQAETEVITKIFEDEDISKSIQSTRSVCLQTPKLPLCFLHNLHAFIPCAPADDILAMIVC